MRRFTALGEFLDFLESHGELARVRREVDPELEVTEIASRALGEGRPALLFERVRGAAFPLAVNVFGSRRRIELALGEEPGRLGEKLLRAVDQLNPPTLAGLRGTRPLWGRLLAARTSRRRRAASQEVCEEPDLSRLPLLRCWPGDGLPGGGDAPPGRTGGGPKEAGGAFPPGRFFTFPLVLTRDPLTGRRNTGIYRMQAFDRQTTGMHWQIQKGGGFHYHRAEQRGEDLEVAVAVGGDPALCLAAAAPLPEGIDELLFAGFLRGAPTPLARARTLSLDVPAGAEFVLEGVVPAGERRLEGPFGDHFGHYSKEAPFPVFHIRLLTRRRRPVFHASLVGKPPKEDRFLGDALQEILSPLLRLLHPEVRALWAYYEAGFHNLLVVAVEERYRREAMKTALSLLGEGQLALTKVAVLVGPEVDPRDFPAVLREIARNFDPRDRFLLLPRVPLDTLDFTGPRMNIGSKVILDATPRPQPVLGPPAGGPRLLPPAETLEALRQEIPGILRLRLWEGALLAVQVEGEGRTVVERLVGHPALGGLPIIAAVSPDVDPADPEALLWGIFTRFDGESDIVFGRRGWRGIAPTFEGPLGIDATWKPGYPVPLEMDPAVSAAVERNWDGYWRGEGR